MADTMNLESLDHAGTTLDWRSPSFQADETAALIASEVEVNAANFQREVLGTPEPVLLGFLTEDSDACNVMARILESLVEDPSVPFKVVLVNADACEVLAEHYGVRKVPTLLIFNRDGLQSRIVGHTTEAQLRRNLEDATRRLQE